MQSTGMQDHFRATRWLMTCAGLVLALGSLGYATRAEAQISAAGRAFIEAATAKTPDSELCDASAPVLDPALSEAFLLEAPSDVGMHRLVIGYYSLSEGLLAGYQSESGKRILLRATWQANGAVDAEVTHRNPATGNLEALIAARPIIDLAAGKIGLIYEVAGVDLLSYLKNGVAKKKAPSVESDSIRQFIEADAGRAYSQAVPALYATLESLESDARLAQLQAPFGAFLTAMQLGTGVYGGFAHADAVLGSAKATKLREECSGQKCLYRGAHFTIQASGLFDMLSKSKLAAGKRASQCRSASSAAVQSPLHTILPIPKNGDGNCTEPGECFGMCGPGCFNPAQIETSACMGHDLCCCKWGQEQCVFSVPAECDGCASLIDAIISYIQALIEMLIRAIIWQILHSLGLA